LRLQQRIAKRILQSLDTLAHARCHRATAQRGTRHAIANEATAPPRPGRNVIDQAVDAPGIPARGDAMCASTCLRRASAAAS